MRPIVFELCADGAAACAAAKAGGAHRIELCSALREGGVTPSIGLIRHAVRHSGLPVHVLLRPRPGDFVYSEAEFDLMVADMAAAGEAGAAGFVLGILRADGAVDRDRTAALVARAGALPVTFHRAFDEAASLPEALEDAIAAGCRRVLTSGGAPDVYQGAPVLADLVAQAGDRIAVAVGGGLRLAGAGALAAQTGATHFHGSVRRSVPDVTPVRRPGIALEDGAVAASSTHSAVDAGDVRAMILALSA